MNSLSEIAFKQIEDNFWYGAYGEFRVVMMKDCSYINATKMCISCGKELCEWLTIKSTEDLFDAFLAEYDVHNPPCKFVHNPRQTDVERLIYGAYLHPDLIPSVAGWISPCFQSKLCRVVNKYIVLQYEHELAKKDECK